MSTEANQEVLAKCEVIFLLLGAGLSVREVAKKVGYSKSMLYRLLPGMEAYIRLHNPEFVSQLGQKPPLASRKYKRPIGNSVPHGTQTATAGEVTS